VSDGNAVVDVISRFFDTEVHFLEKSYREKNAIKVFPEICPFCAKNLVNDVLNVINA